MLLSNLSRTKIAGSVKFWRRDSGLKLQAFIPVVLGVTKGNSSALADSHVLPNSMNAQLKAPRNYFAT